MRRLALALCLTLLLVAPLVEAHGTRSRTYIASLGASYGAEGISTNRVSGPGTFESNHGHYGVRVTLTDAANLDPFIAICVDLSANGFCDDAEGDLLWEGSGSVEGWASEPFDSILIFSDAFQFDPDTGTAHVSTRGETRVEWLDGQQAPTPPPTRQRDGVEEALHTIITAIFGLGIL